MVKEQITEAIQKERRPKSILATLIAQVQHSLDTQGTWGTWTQPWWFSPEGGCDRFTATSWRRNLLIKIEHPNWPAARNLMLSRYYGLICPVLRWPVCTVTAYWVKFMIQPKIGGFKWMAWVLAGMVKIGLLCCHPLWACQIRCSAQVRHARVRQGRMAGR